VAPPHEHLLDLHALLARRRDRLVGLGLVVDQLAVAVVAVDRHQDVALRVGDPAAAGRTAEPAEHLGVDHAEAGAREHRHRQLGEHRQVERHAVAGFDAGKLRQERGELVHPVVEVVVGDRLDLLVLGLRDPDEGRLVGARLEVAIDAVDGRVQLAADEPLPKRRVAGVEDRVPLGIPREQIRVLGEALGEALLAETLEDRRVVRVRLCDKALRRLDVLLFTPVNGDVRVGGRGRAAGVSCVGRGALWSHPSSFPHSSLRAIDLT
jgi:hypothetical protein